MYRNLGTIAHCNRAAIPGKTLGLPPLREVSVNCAHGTAGSTSIALCLHLEGHVEASGLRVWEEQNEVGGGQQDSQSAMPPRGVIEPPCGGGAAGIQ